MRSAAMWLDEYAVSHRNPTNQFLHWFCVPSIVGRALGLLWTAPFPHELLFTLAWIGQFVGHAIEGRRPSFFQDLQFLLIGPLWLLADV
jgi:uncharacterized membrane protein YGL010W